jgi:carbamoyltransferase
VGFTGGVAQNVIWNTQLKNIYPNLKILPCTSDECLSLGMMEYLRQKYNLPKMHFSNFPFVESDESPKENPNLDTIIKVSEYLANGKIVAWYQGNGEIGPRALGNRSIFLDPRIHNGKDIINAVKKRESYRPFGASILEEYAKEYFDMNYFNPYMLYVGFSQKNNLPAITHVDNTCRVQTVSKQFPGFLRTLLEQFYRKTKCPVLLNTSLNLAGKPIAGSIEDAKTLFNTRPIDVLVIGNNIIVK